MSRQFALIVLFILLIASLAMPGAARAERAPQAGPYEVTVLLTLVPSPSYAEQLVTLTVEVKANNPAAGTPGGLVQIKSSQDVLCMITLDAAGKGFCTLQFHTPTTLPLKAIYIGANPFLPGASPEVQHVVLARHVPVVTITSHEPSPSVLNQIVRVDASVTSAGPLPTGALTIFRSGSDCVSPPAATAVDQCTATLAGGAGGCSLPLTQAGAVTLCAAYSGDTPTLPAIGKAAHWVSQSNTALEIKRVEPSPSLLNQPATVYFSLTSPLGVPPQDGLVTVTSGTQRCTATLAAGHCAITLRKPNLQQITAAYAGAETNNGLFEASVSNVWMQRVNGAPTDVQMSTSRVNSLLPVGGSVAGLTTTDPNPDETHIYTLVAGSGAEDNTFFLIDGSRLVSRRAMPQQRGRLSIRVRSTDPAGLFIEKSFVLSLFGGELPATGFAPASVTRLPAQPAAKAYRALDDLTIEIPRLGVSAAVLGVPWQEDGWDATWLGQDIGWLDGTAFPTWLGNSVLVGHNFLADGSKGPFAGLAALKWGDRIVVRAFGTTAVYEVRAVDDLQPGDASALRHEEKPWLTLITCQNFNDTLRVYRSRVVVRAILVELQGAAQ